MCLLLLQTVLSGGAICYALIMKKMIDCAVEQDRQGFFYGLMMFALLIGIQLILRIWLRYLEEFTRSGLENTLKVLLRKEKENNE